MLLNAKLHGKCPDVELFPFLEMNQKLSLVLVSEKCIENGCHALAGLLSWLDYCPKHQKVAGSISDQGTHLGCGFGPWLEQVRETTN